MNRSHGAALILLSLVLPATVCGDAIYKSVDAQGNVTYSAEPPTPGSARQIQELQLQPGPSSADRQSAEQRLQAGEEADERRSNARQAKESQQRSAISRAQQELIQAKALLEQAKIQGEGDWQYLATGGRVLSESYFNRITAAEARVQAAEEALRDARRP